MSATGADLAAGRSNKKFDGLSRAWRSIRLKLMVPVLIAALGVSALGAMQVNDSLSLADQAAQASALATASGAIGSLVHEVANEFLQASDVLQTNRGRLPDETPAVLNQQHRATDAAVAAFADGIRTIRSTTPDLATLCIAAEQALVSLPYARRLGRENLADLTEVRGYYDHILTSLLAVGAAVPPHLRDTRLIELAQATSLVAGLDRFAALQLDLIMRGLRGRELAPAEFTLLASWTGGETKDSGSLRNLGVAGADYDSLIRQASSTTAATMRQTILDGRGAAETLTTTPAVWFAAQSQQRQGLWNLEVELSNRLSTASANLRDSARDQAFLLGLLYATVVVITLAGAAVVAVRISRRLRQTQLAALTASRVELPTAIANVTAARDVEAVRVALNESSARVDAMLVTNPDEIGELAAVFGAIHRQALRLAADQAMLRMEVQAMFVALSRRGQTLIQRQIHLIDEFGRNEADPDTLSRLFALDHLAARMRRNEENLLVLAGGEPGRWITRPVAVLDLIRAAAQEIEEYRRVQAQDIPELAVTAHVAGDVIHLLAELLENATTFSPPRSVVRVGARRDVHGLVITVADEGIGLPQRNLVEANSRLARPSGLTSTLVGTMGLLVVARLAQRHGIEVRLSSVPAGGTTATVTIPARSMVPILARDQLQPGRWLHGLPQHERPATASAPQVPAELDRPAANLTTSMANRPSAIGAAPAHPDGWRAAPIPAPAAPAPSTAPVSRTRLNPTAWTIAGRTAAGHATIGPARRPPETVAQAGSGWSLPQGTPDPETVRARLSSLASGLAAANAQMNSVAVSPPESAPPASPPPAYRAPSANPAEPEDRR